LLAAVIIAALVAFSLSRKPTSEELDKQRKRLLADFKSADIETLTLEEGDRRIVCRREGADEWRVLEPIQVPADGGQVEGILDRLELAEKVASIYPEKGKSLDLAQYGLDKPARRITATARGGAGATWTVLVGKEGGVADSVFVALEGRPAVYAVRKDAVQKTAATATDLRSKNLAPRIGTFDLKKACVSAAELDGKAAFDVECEKPKDKWELTKPLHDLADSQAIEALANKLYDHRIRAEDFVVDDPTKAAEYGLDNPLLTVTLASDSKTQTVIFSRRQEGAAAAWYALQKGEQAIVRVPESLMDGLRRGPSELRDRALAGFWADDVAEIAATGPAREVLLKKEDGDWKIKGEPAAPADNDVTQQFLSGLKDAQVESFIADAPAGLEPYGLADSQRLLLTLKKGDGSVLSEVALGSATPDGQGVYAMRPPYPAVLSLKKQTCLDNAQAGRLAFLKRLVLQEPQSEAVELALERQGRRFHCQWSDRDSRWDLLEPIQGKADEEAVRAILADLAYLRAEGFAAEKTADLAPFGLDRPEATVSVTYRAPAMPRKEGAEEAPAAQRVRTLLVGAATDTPAKGRYARLAEDERVFVLADSVAAHAQADLASKDICKATELTALTFRTDGATVRFTRDASRGVWTDAEGRDLEPQLAARVADAAKLLESLVALRVADYTEKSPALYGFDKPRLIVELEEKATKGKQVVIGSEVEDGNCYVRGPATGFVHVAAKADVGRLLSVLEPVPRTSESAATPAEAAP